MRQNLPETLKLRLAELPHRSGVYLFKDRSGKPLYIGKALSLKKRVSGHFRHFGEAHSKEGLMLAGVRRIDIIETPTEAEALLLEASLVKEQLPKYNKMLRDDKSYPYLKLTDETYPRLLVTRQRKADGAKYFGPYTSVHLLRQALKMLRREFPLRTCRKMPKKVCLQYHLGLCGGPCEGHQVKEAYLAAARELSRFLEGRRDALVRNLSKRMREYSSERRYEMAQAMRDAVRALASVTVPARADRTSAQVLAEFREVFSLPSLPRRVECFDVSNIQGHEAVGSMVVFEDGEPLRKHYRRFRVRTVKGIDDYRMMRELVKRRYTGTLAQKLPVPDLVLIDGGKGHLSAAKKELEGAGFGSWPLLSIAKQHEIVFSPAREAPYVLSPSSPVLHMIRHLRDEAHRFAIRYHRRLHRGAMLGKKGVLMKRSTALAFAAVLWASCAQADMLEVRDRGVLNGQVLSETDSEVQFKEADGSVRVFPRRDVLFMEIDRADTGAKASGFSKTLKAKWTRFVEAMKKAPKALKKKTTALTKRFTSSMAKPLDRGKVNAKSDEFARAMDDASKTIGAKAQKDRAIHREIKKQTQFMNESWGTGEEGDGKGRFSSLD